MSESYQDKPWTKPRPTGTIPESPIKIVQGFLTLTETNSTLGPCYVKGSSITAIRPYKTGAMVAFDTLGSMPLFHVKETVSEILEAIAESYRQARNR